MLLTPELKDVSRRAQELYEKEFRAQLENEHWGEFVAIEPDSKQYFLGRKPEAALAAAEAGCPGKLTYLGRVGFRAAYEMGCAQ